MVVELDNTGNMELNEYKYTDTITGETYTVSCESWKINRNESIDENFLKWVNGRIIKREEVWN